MLTYVAGGAGDYDCLGRYRGGCHGECAVVRCAWVCVKFARHNEKKRARKSWKISCVTLHDISVKMFLPT